MGVTGDSSPGRREGWSKIQRPRVPLPASLSHLDVRILAFVSLLIIFVYVRVAYVGVLQGDFLCFSPSLPLFTCLELMPRDQCA